MQKILLLILIAFTAALSGAASKYVLQDISVESLMFLRFLIALILILPYCSFLREKSRIDIAILIFTSL
jgi:drug/metabolite transporter (DMT)-like permease